MANRISLSFKAMILFTILIWIPMTIDIAILYIFKLLDIKYGFLIYATILIIEGLVIAAFLYIIIKNNNTDVLQNGIVVPKDKFVDRHIIAENEILSKCIIPIHPMHDSIMRVNMELGPDEESKPLVFCIIRKCDREICKQEINIDKSSSSDSIKHIFRFKVDPKEYINFKFNRDIKVKSFVVDELYIP